MTREEIVALFDRREAAWQARDAAALAADHAPDGVVISPTGGVLEGRVEIERIYRVWFTAFADLVFTIEDLIVEGNRVACSAASPAAMPVNSSACRHGPPDRGRLRLLLPLRGYPHRARTPDPRFHRAARPGWRAAGEAGGRDLAES